MQGLTAQQYSNSVYKRLDIGLTTYSYCHDLDSSDYKGAYDEKGLMTILV